MQLSHIFSEYFSNLSYLGMFCGMFLSNSFIPFPSEIVMIPAGYLAGSKEVSFSLSVVAGTLGGISGSLFNYILSFKLGRELLLKLKIVKESHVNKSEKFFEKYGILSVLFGSLMPVIRQYISVPAGISRMKLHKFISCISVGVLIWIVFLTTLGYFVGDNRLIILQILNNFNTTLIFLAVLTASTIVLFKIKKWRKCRVQTKAEIKNLVRKEVEDEVKEELRDEIKELVEEEVEEEVKDLVKKGIKAKIKKK